MSLWTRLFFLALASLALCACQTFGGQPPRPFDTNKILDELRPSFDKQQIDACSARETDACRNAIVTEQIRAIDIVFSEYERVVLKTAEGINVTGDATVAILGAAGTVTGGTQAKSILAALSSAVTGTKGAFDKNVYFQNSIQVLIGRMRALRKGVLADVRKNLLQPHDKYPLSQALFDVESYFVAGTIVAAVSDIEKNSKEKSDQADQEMQKTLELSYGADSNSVLLRAFWRPNGPVDADRDKQLRNWIDSNVLKGLDPASFINAKEYADPRKKAVQDLVNPAPPSH